MGQKIFEVIHQLFEFGIFSFDFITFEAGQLVEAHFQNGFGLNFAEPKLLGETGLRFITVFRVTNDADHEPFGDQWYREGRRFPGMIIWRQGVYDLMTYGHIVEAFEELAGREESPFAIYPIVRIRPPR